MSTHINAANRGEIAETILLPGDPLRAKFIAETFFEKPVLFNETRNMLGYTGTYKGFPISVMGTGMGMPSMGIYSYELIKEYGCKNLVRVGSAGAFHLSVKLNEIVVALSSSMDSNWQHTYKLPGYYAPCCDLELLLKVLDAAKSRNIKLHAGNVFCGDVFYEDDPDWWMPWAKMGVLAVDMESAALYMNAARLGAKALTLLTISDQFVTGEALSREERQTSFLDMMNVALDAVCQ